MIGKIIPVPVIIIPAQVQFLVRHSRLILLIQVRRAHLPVAVLVQADLIWFTLIMLVAIADLIVIRLNAGQ